VFVAGTRSPSGQMVGQSEGQFGGFGFNRKCNGSNGLSHDLIHIQSLESYQLDDLPADGRKKKPRQDPEAREGHDSSYLI